MNNWILVEEEQYPIRPHHIDASKHFFDAFNNMETEESAGWIVRFLQDRNEGWKPFTLDEINAYYERHSGFAAFVFGRLINAQSLRTYNGPEIVGGGWIVQGEDQKYYVTHEFITPLFWLKSSTIATSIDLNA